jgi:carboxymethylenebutenolidase
VLGLYGGKDPGIPAPHIEAMSKALAAAGGASKIIAYDDTGHAFHADYRPSYNKADAEESWSQATNWLKQHGV